MATEHNTLAADNLHGAFPYGLLSARPAVPTNTYNPYYYATDNNKLYLYNGFTWAEAYVDVDATNFTSTGVSNLTNLLCPKVICSTASATAAKTAASPGFILTTGVRVKVKFDNANTATTPTLNIESTGDKAIYNEAGVAVSATRPAYFPAGATVEFWYDGTNWVYVNRIVDSYINGATFYNQYANGWLEQGGQYYGGSSGAFTPTITFPKAFKNTNYNRHVTGGYGTNTNTGYDYCYNVTSSTMVFIVPGGTASWSAKGY